MNAMPPSSVEFSPFLNWQCPQCLQCYSSQNNDSNTTQITFLRGTCRHDVCRECITKIMSLRNFVYRAGATTRRAAANNDSLIEVSCPIDQCSCGKFHLDRAQFSARSMSEQRNNDQVIDLCEEKQEKQENTKSDHHTAGIVKKEVKEEQPADLHDCVASIKVEQLSNTKALKSDYTNIKPPLPVTEKRNLKPLFAVGDAVFAAWWDPQSDANRKEEASWYPGRVLSYKKLGTSRYGPSRTYTVKYDDGDQLDKLEDYWLFPAEDYQLTMKFEEMGWKPIGVRKKLDKKSKIDKWANTVGWYEVTVDGQTQSFSLLANAMKAHDACVIREHGTQTKKSYLNMPEDYPGLFAAETKLEVSEGAKSTTNTNNTNVVTPMSELSVKKEPSGSNSNGSNVEGQSDEESRFSDVDESEADHEGAAEWREVKRRRLDLSLAENEANTTFWSVNREHIEFTRQAFMTKSIFHLNSFVDGKKKKNQAFALFIRESVATPGFNPLPISLDIDRIAIWTYTQLRDALVKSNGDWGASQTALWLKNATVGSFVIMRHEYPKCKFCPQRLKDNGKYIGPVYVIGVITKKIVPWSAEEQDLAENSMGEFSNHHWSIHNVCRVSWRRMGHKKALKEATQKYINHVCQPTLQRICDGLERVYAGGATSDSIRRDLWSNATIPIRSDEFTDIFDHRNHREEE